MVEVEDDSDGSRQSIEVSAAGDNKGLVVRHVDADYVCDIVSICLKLVLRDEGGISCIGVVFALCVVVVSDDGA